jgi:HlyD family secretion protein
MSRSIAFRSLVIIGLAALSGACADPPADANGRFEATEITVSAEASGTLLTLTAQEGDAVSANAVLGTIDTVALTLQRAELDARAASLRAQRDEVAAQGRALTAQSSAAAENLARTTRLASAGAATAQQLERDQRDASALAEQRLATVAGSRALQFQIDAIAAQREQLDERLQNTVLHSPVTGVVLSRYVEPGELVQTGTPVLKVASLDSLVLRAYISDAQLSSVALGQGVTVQVDDGSGGFRTMPGRVTWIAQAAEFTPTPIQTREERVSQVYAVKVTVANPDGLLRIGMPGEVLLPTATASAPQD